MRCIVKKISALIIFILIFSIITGCSSDDNSKEFDAKVIDFKGDYVLVEPIKGGVLQEIDDNESRYVFFNIANLDDIGISTEDIVTATYTGEITQLDPPEVYVIRWSILEKAKP